MNSKLLLLLAFCFSWSANAKDPFGTTLVKLVDKYSAAKLVKMDVTKKVKSELLGKETNYSGEVFLAKEKFRLNTTTPDKAEIIFDGKVLLNIQYPPAEFGGAAQVLKSKINKQNKSQILLSALFDKNTVKKNFQVMAEKSKGSDRLISVKPLTGDLSVKQIELTVSSDNILKELSYNDDAGNETSMIFSNVKFEKDMNPEIFKAKIPKDAQVTEL